MPRLAQRFREPLWIRPAQKAAQQAEVSAPIDLLEGLEQVNPQIRVLSCRPGSTPGQLALRLQNLSPQRQSWTLDSPRRWRRGNAETWQSGALVLKPWQVVALELV